MRVGYLQEGRRVLARGAALVLVGGLAAGCSSGVSRFTSDMFTGSTSNQRSIIKAENQPFPGDVAKPAPVNGGYTASVNRAAVETAPMASAPVTRSSLPPVSSAPVAQQPVMQQPAAQPPVAAAPIRQPALDARATGSVAKPPQAAPAAVPAVVTGNVREGWSRDGGKEVTLQEGETINSLSRRFGVPPKAIIKANGLSDANAVRVGQKVVIPTYVRVSKGAADSTKNLAAKPGVDAPAGNKPAPVEKPVDKVAVLPQQPRPAESGQQQATGDAKPQNPKPANAGNTYTVVSGDTLYSVAKKTGAKTEAIKSANGLTTGALKIGQKLVIPAAAPVEKVSAAPKPVDTIVTGTTGAAKPTAVKPKNETPATYTPPKRDDKPIAAVEAASDATSPDGTGIGKMRWPVRGRVIGTYGQGNNDGIDIAVPEGTPVKAAENGVVIFAGEGLKDFGKTVLVRHSDGKVTVYGHTGEIKVNRGDTVKRGQEIARSGMTGKTDSPKLHFEVRQNSSPVDPKQFLE